MRHELNHFSQVTDVCRDQQNFGDVFSPSGMVTKSIQLRTSLLHSKECMSLCYHRLCETSVNHFFRVTRVCRYRQQNSGEVFSKYSLKYCDITTKGRIYYTTAMHVVNWFFIYSLLGKVDLARHQCSICFVFS